MVAVFLTASCGNAVAPSTQSAEKVVSATAPRDSTENELTVDWEKDTRSPNSRPPLLTYSKLESLCGEPDVRLDQVALWIGKHGPLGQDENDIDRLTFALRASGTPYVRPVAWSRGWAASSLPPIDELEAEFRLWLTSIEQLPKLRCGIAETEQNNQRRVVVVAAQAPAELTVPLPTTARVGRWLTFEANLLNEAENSRVILLGPSGEPQTVPTSQQGSCIRARFAAKSPGKWFVQLLASAETGPRPMLEAVIYVDALPERVFVEKSYPGETAAAPNLPPDRALNLIVNAARQQTGRPPMNRDPLLDTLALEHATAMLRAGRVGHDVGNGSTKARLSRAGLNSHLAGENVVHAADPHRAHRALWASPSHRANLLHRGFARWGLGVVSDEQGTLWVCEIFASRD
jgi:hypothetical protein